MRRAIVLIALFLVAVGAGPASAARDASPTQVEVSFTPQDGCRAQLFQFAAEPPYRRPAGRAYRLPHEQRRLASALRRPGRERGPAEVHGGPDVPEACSGGVLEAARSAGFSQVAFWFPPPASAAPAEDISVCELATDPARFHGRRIRLRGLVHQAMTPDYIAYTLMDLACHVGVDLAGTDEPFWRLFQGRELRDRVVAATVIGTPGASMCYARPPGSSCGPYFRVESYEDVERPDLCWGYRPVSEGRYELITQPCPADDAR
ncbi:MAG TPA: hypothetical protein VEW04_03075 [Allosphingosinicella sp.]|nr:hypothetical protein [Allosphingosinicella sp.]